MRTSRWSIILALITSGAVFATDADSSGRLPNAVIGEAYSQRLAVRVAGVPPFKYSFDSSGDHPDWLEVSDTPQGVFLKGKPPQGSTKTYTLKVVAKDSSESPQETLSTYTLVVGEGAPIYPSKEATSGDKPTCKPVNILTGLKPGSNTLKGSATPSQGSVDIKLQVDAIYGAANSDAALYALQQDNKLRKESAGKGIPARQPLYFRKSLPLQDSASSRVGSDGTFTLPLAASLDGGETIIITQQGCQYVRPHKEDQTSSPTGTDYVSALKSTQAKAKKNKQTKTDNNTPKQTPKPTTGSGTSSSDSSGGMRQRPEVAGLRYVSWGQDAGKPAAPPAPPAPAAAPAAGGGDTSSQGVATAYSVPGGIDWGRVKALFMIGALFSNQNQSFSQSNLFASFDLDKAWSLPCNYGYAETAAGYLPYPGDPCSVHPGLNTFFETRLTAIPVSSNTATDSKASQPPPAPNDFNSFLSNKKSARFAFGLYAPFMLTRWTHDEGPQALYIAPLAKAGFDTITDSTSITATTTSGDTTTSTTEQVPRLYNFFGGGVRIGHYKLHNNENEGPDHISHLDVMLAKFSNFESKVDNCPQGFTTCRARLWRLSFEGLLQIPTPDNLPLYIGLGANIGQKVFGAGHVVPGGDAGDDLRFFFGTRLDLGSLVTKLKGSSGSATNGKTVPAE